MKVQVSAIAGRLDEPAASRRLKALAFLLVPLCAVGGLAMLPPIAQPEAYHHFHDARTIFGIPNFLNVVSNLPFVAIGLAGLGWLLRRPANLEADLRAAYAVVFSGLAATGVGSALYHWSPDNASLIWDRLPIAVAFMALLAALIGERVSVAAGRRLLLPGVVFGVLSVGYWVAYDDLRPYLMAQFFPVLCIPLLLWLYPARYGRGGDFMIGIGCYGAAKLFEAADGTVFALGHVVSGHTMKHVAAALGSLLILRMLMKRRAFGRPCAN